MSGPIRKMVDTMRQWCKFSGDKLTMEDVADIFDAMNAAKLETPSSTEAPATLANMQPAKGKH